MKPSVQTPVPPKKERKKPNQVQTRAQKLQLVESQKVTGAYLFLEGLLL
jgi:hypothetical protein